MIKKILKAIICLGFLLLIIVFGINFFVVSSTQDQIITKEEYCNLKGIPTMVWAGEEKVVMKNIRTSETAETTIEKLLGTDK